MEEYTAAECHQLLNNLFPNSFASDDIMSALAPNGWENTPYVMPVPTLEDAYQGAKARKSFDEMMVRIQSGNIAGIENIEDFESFEDFKAHYQVETPDYFLELQETVANCLWDIFSDNNDVVKDNKVYHLGSFRGSARFIADWLNSRSEKEYTYIDFYMGNSVQDDDNKCDFSPVYELIFARLKQADLDWIYNFSQMRLVDLSAAKEQKPDEPANYDPNKALEQELKQKKEQQEKDDFKAKIEEMNAKAREDALYKPPPTVVQAFRTIYGRFPIGWPPIV